jgi:hypothetical protein
MVNKYKNFDWQAIGFNFGNWEEELIWSLDTPVEEINIKNLLWHLDIPYWENDNEERWTVSPRDVINKEEGTSAEQKRVENVDISYPIELFENEGKYFILDGLHRLVKLYNQKSELIKVRITPKERFSEISSESPFELPS